MTNNKNKEYVTGPNFRENSLALQIEEDFLLTYD